MKGIFAATAAVMPVYPRMDGPSIVDLYEDG